MNYYQNDSKGDLLRVVIAVMNLLIESLQLMQEKVTI